MLYEDFTNNNLNKINLPSTDFNYLMIRRRRIVIGEIPGFYLFRVNCK